MKTIRTILINFAASLLNGKKLDWEQKLLLDEALKELETSLLWDMPELSRDATDLSYSESIAYIQGFQDARNQYEESINKVLGVQ